MKIKERYRAVFEYLEKAIPLPETELQYTNPYELLTAVILSAQCTDKRVNQITPPLFEAYPDPYKMSQASQQDIFNFIRTCSYPNNKAKHLLGMSKMLVEEYKGEVPSDVSELQKLPGVGRKTANVIASVVYRKPAMAVDTHVFRVSHRLGLVKNAKTPLAAELQLVKHIPEDMIHKAHHWLILHGRYTCLARNPKCSDCGLTEICPYYLAINKDNGGPPEKNS